MWEEFQRHTSTLTFFNSGETNRELRVRERRYNPVQPDDQYKLEPAGRLDQGAGAGQPEVDTGRGVDPRAGAGQPEVNTGRGVDPGAGAGQPEVDTGRGVDPRAGADQPEVDTGRGVDPRAEAGQPEVDTGRGVDPRAGAGQPEVNTGRGVDPGAVDPRAGAGQPEVDTGRGVDPRAGADQPGVNTGQGVDPGAGAGQPEVDTGRGVDPGAGADQPGMDRNREITADTSPRNKFTSGRVEGGGTSPMGKTMPVGASSGRGDDEAREQNGLSYNDKNLPTGPDSPTVTGKGEATGYYGSKGGTVVGQPGSLGVPRAERPEAKKPADGPPTQTPSRDATRADAQGTVKETKTASKPVEPDREKQTETDEANEGEIVFFIQNKNRQCAGENSFKIASELECRLFLQNRHRTLLLTFRLLSLSDAKPLPHVFSTPRLKPILLFVVDLQACLHQAARVL